MPRRIKRRQPKLLELPNKGVAKLTNRMNPEQMLEKQEEAFRLRVDEGLDYRSIATRMGIDKSTANRYVKAVAKAKYQGMIERDEMVLLENNARYDQIVALWTPLLKPLIEGDLIVGETKTDRKGELYDITIPAFESAKTATEVLLKAMSQREKLNGFQQPYSTGKDADKQIEGASKAFFELLRGLASQPSKPIQATEVREIEDGQKDI